MSDRVSEDRWDAPGLIDDRRSAGRQLAERLQERSWPESTLVVALPRGGVIVGAEIARALHRPLEVLIVRKLGAPGNPEVAIGAIAEGGGVLVDPRFAMASGFPEDAVQTHLDEVVRTERAEVSRRVRTYRQGRPLATIRERPVILVDDGLATGLTFKVAVHALQKLGASSIVAALPVCPAGQDDTIRGMIDDVVALRVPRHMNAVGEFYADFSEVSDAEVMAALETSK